jgi:hypothetical protein
MNTFSKDTIQNIKNITKNYLDVYIRTFYVHAQIFGELG